MLYFVQVSSHLYLWQKYDRWEKREIIKYKQIRIDIQLKEMKIIILLLLNGS